jgi:hypothetical protein
VTLAWRRRTLCGGARTFKNLMDAAVAVLAPLLRGAGSTGVTALPGLDGVVATVVPRGTFHPLRELVGAGTLVLVHAVAPDVGEVPEQDDVTVVLVAAGPLHGYTPPLLLPSDDDDSSGGAATPQLVYSRTPVVPVPLATARSGCRMHTRGRGREPADRPSPCSALLSQSHALLGGAAAVPLWVLTYTATATTSALQYIGAHPRGARGWTADIVLSGPPSHPAPWAVDPDSPTTWGRPGEVDKGATPDALFQRALGMPVPPALRVVRSPPAQETESSHWR